VQTKFDWDEVNTPIAILNRWGVSSLMGSDLPRDEEKPDPVRLILRLAGCGFPPSPKRPLPRAGKNAVYLRPPPALDETDYSFCKSTSSSTMTCHSIFSMAGKIRFIIFWIRKRLTSVHFQMI
jgi:hypothetical protein